VFITNWNGLKKKLKRVKMKTGWEIEPRKAGMQFSSQRQTLILPVDWIVNDR
jgi:hypothetical protein